MLKPSVTSSMRPRDVMSSDTTVPKHVDNLAAVDRQYGRMPLILTKNTSFLACNTCKYSIAL